MQTAEKYLDSFTKIEHHLRKLLGPNEQFTFNELVTRASEKNALIRFYKDPLISFASLRNAIVHSPKKEGKPIADPREDILHQIEDIWRKISEPKLVCNLFKGEVFTSTWSSSLANVLKTMVENDYSQAPIIENDKIVGLLTKESIANWMGKKAIEGEPDFLLSETLVRDVISTNITTVNYKIISRRTNLVEARDHFINRMGASIPLETLLITDSGKANEKLLGIITRSEDLGEVIKNI